VASSSDQPKLIDLTEIWTNLKAGRAMVGGGIFVTIQIDYKTAGDLLTKTGSFDILLRVEAAEWVPARELDLIANGEVIQTLALQEPGLVDPGHPALRLEQTVTLDPALDTWYAALAKSAAGETLDPVFRGCRAVGMTNAIRVDVDGNGQFDAPDQ
jgi:hypothetical protein